jgi:uncharacterized protein YecE (DUF72 family)
MLYEIKGFMKKGKIYIGTSGWHYKHSKGTFYPADIKDANRFAYYQKFFDTVELNNPFYHLPPAKTFAGWRKATPRNFIFSVKASRYITHMKKLKPGKKSINLFFSHADKLEKKLGPVLFQLPPGWNINAERFEKFLSSLPKEHRYTFEFRNHSWYEEKIYALLEKHKIAFCIYELAGHLSPIRITTNFIYIRLHGPGDKYQGSYTDRQLKEWAVKCSEWIKQGKDVYVYFDNDQLGYAAFNAIRLKKLVK